MYLELSQGTKSEIKKLEIFQQTSLELKRHINICIQKVQQRHRYSRNTFLFWKGPYRYSTIDTQAHWLTVLLGTTIFSGPGIQINKVVFMQSDEMEARRENLR